MFGWLRKLWSLFKQMLVVSKEGYLLISRAKSMVKFVGAVVLLIKFIFAWPVLLVMYYFRWTRKILYLILRYVWMYDTAIKLEGYIAKGWSYVQEAGAFATASYRPTKFAYGYEDGSRSGIYLKPPANYKDVFNCQLFDFMVRDCESGNLVEDKSVLEIDCGASGGISYIGEIYRPRFCIGTVSCPSTKQQLEQERLIGAEYLYSISNDYGDHEVLAGRQFDVVLCVNVLTDQVSPERMKLISELVTHNGVLKIAEIVDRQRSNHFEFILESTGMKITSQRDITGNVIRSALLQRQKHTLKEQLLELVDGYKTREIHRLESHNYNLYTLSRTVL